MARRRKKKNIFKSTMNLIILIILLVIIFFLVQKFIFPLFQERERIEIEESREEIEVEPPSVLEEEQVVLYFADDNAQYLVPEYRNIQKTEEMAKQAIIELIKGPTSSNLYPTVPSTTRVNGLYINDGIAYVDLSSEIIKNHSGGSTGELLTVYSIVLTLTSFPDINKVQIIVDGNSGETLVGHVDTSIPLEGDDSWLKR
jgi:germination protein M